MINVIYRTSLDENKLRVLHMKYEVGTSNEEIPIVGEDVRLKFPGLKEDLYEVYKHGGYSEPGRFRVLVVRKAVKRQAEDDA